MESHQALNTSREGVRKGELGRQGENVSRAQHKANNASFSVYTQREFVSQAVESLFSTTQHHQKHKMPENEERQNNNNGEKE